MLSCDSVICGSCVIFIESQHSLLTVQVVMGGRGLSHLEIVKPLSSDTNKREGTG